MNKEEALLIIEELDKQVQHFKSRYEKLVAELDDVKGELQTVKNMNKNWAISEGWALQEIEKLKAELDKQSEVKVLEQKLIDFSVRIKELEDLVTIERNKNQQAFANGCRHTIKNMV